MTPAQKLRRRLEDECCAQTLMDARLLLQEAGIMTAHPWMEALYKERLAELGAPTDSAAGLRRRLAAEDDLARVIAMRRAARGEGLMLRHPWMEIVYEERMAALSPARVSGVRRARRRRMA